jgi:hypothetical protein
MATNSEKVTELNTELTAIKAAMLSMITSGQSGSLDGTSFNKVQYDSLNKRRSEIERIIQKLESASGSITGIDMSCSPYA